MCKDLVLFPMAESDRFIWRLLAASLDKQLEVREAAVETLLQNHFAPGSKYCQEIIVHLIGKFVASACLSIRRIKKQTKNKRLAEVEGFDSSPDSTLILSAITGAIHLRLLGTSSSTSESGESQSLVPLLVAASAALLEERELSNDRLIVTQVTQLLRSLSLFQYRGSVLAMLSSRGPSYTGASIARWYKALCVIDDETEELLEQLESVVILKGVSMALEGFGIGHDPHIAQLGDVSLQESKLEELGVHALEHVLEMLEIPSDLVTTKDSCNSNQAGMFLHSSYYFLKIADSILKDSSWLWNHDKHYLVQGMILWCAALASAENDATASLSWVTKDIRELTVEIVFHMGKSFSQDKVDGAEEVGIVQRLHTESYNGIERMIVKTLPVLLLNFKSQLKDNLSTDSEGNYGVSSGSVSLASAIIAAHQMCWCLMQVKHPHLSALCTSLMPCVLMALDHYSPHVKRQAIKVVIHLVDNLNPSELRWYKDATLDCVTRSIIGCDKLWPLVVKMAVQTVTCIEGKNPRGSWYRSILDEMLGELERHQDDASKCVVWLQHVTDLFESMGLVLVLHFKRLLPLLFFWLHTLDDKIRLLVNLFHRCLILFMDLAILSALSYVLTLISCCYELFRSYAPSLQLSNIHGQECLSM